jgi:hypothetical protein
LSRSPLYRKAASGVILLALIAAGAALAQEMHHAHQLRSVALLELYGPASRPTGGRLLPVFVLDRDKYYDAATYDATPRPLALDPGTVYEALNGLGESAGFFTVGLAKQQKGDWFGLGQWKTAAEVHAAEVAAAKRHERENARDEGPPTLHKGGSSGASSTTSSAGGDHPQLKKRPDSAPSKPSTASTETPAPRVQNDPDRPTLRHGSGEQVKAMLEEPPSPRAAPRPGLQPRPGGPTQVFLAVSDPDGTGTLHSLNFPWKPDEEKALKAKSIAIAEAELNTYLQARRGAPGKGQPLKGKKSPPPVRLVNPMVVSYDLNLDNNAEFIVSGEASGVYVLVVTRTDLEFEPRKIFSAVTDKDHLDAFPRLELIGPVDADGKGKAELLFRATYDDGYRYRLYKTGREEMWQLWESGLYEP